MVKSAVRLGAAAGCAYAAWLFGQAGMYYHPIYLPVAAACGTGAAILARDGMRGMAEATVPEPAVVVEDPQ